MGIKKGPHHSMRTLTNPHKQRLIMRPGRLFFVQRNKMNWGKEFCVLQGWQGIFAFCDQVRTGYSSLLQSLATQKSLIKHGTRKAVLSFVRDEKQHENKMRAVAFIAIGVALIIFGYDDYNASVAHVFTSPPTDGALWLFIGGLIASITGIFNLTADRS